MGEKDAERFAKFMTSRRNFTKIAIAAVAATIGGLAVLYELLKEKGQKEEEITPEIEKTAAEIEKEFDIEKASSIELLEKLAEYPEAIEKSRKQTLEEFAEELAKKPFDNLILGRRYVDAGEADKEAVYFLEQLLKNGRKISTIGLDFLSYVLSRDVEPTEQFNKGELSFNEMREKTNVGQESLLRFARKYSIPIVGLEELDFNNKEQDQSRRDLSRFGKISERVGEITKENKEKGIVVIPIGQGHVTVDSWENENLLNRLYKFRSKIYEPPKKEILEKKYTIKQYLEKELGLNAVAIQVELGETFAAIVKGAIDVSFKGSPRKDLEKAKELWQKFNLGKEKEPFVVPYPKAEDNTFAMIIPGKFPETPDSLAKNT